MEADYAATTSMIPRPALPGITGNFASVAAPVRHHRSEIAIDVVARKDTTQGETADSIGPQSDCAWTRWSFDPAKPELPFASKLLMQSTDDGHVKS